jgi:hypothetical protein
MASDLRELRLMLKASGFELKRRNKHPIYHDGFTQIVLPSGNGMDWRMKKWLQIQIKKAVEIRNERLQQQPN